MAEIRASRRRLLQAAGVMSAAAAAGLPAGCSRPGVDRPLPQLGNLSAFEGRLMRRLSEVLLPIVPADGLLDVAKVPVLENVDAMFATFPAGPRGDVATGLKLFHYGAIFIGLNLRPFLGLDDAAATDYCLAWENGGNVQRALMHALKQIVYVSYWREPATWGPIGYDGPFSKPHGIGRQGNAPLPADNSPQAAAAEATP